MHRAIVWQDRRTAGICDELKARGLEATFQAKTGLVLDPYFSGTKIAWLLHNVPGIAARAKTGELAFGTVDSWLIYNLTGGTAHVTDVSNASRTLLFNIHTMRWDDELLTALDVPAGAPAGSPSKRRSPGDGRRASARQRDSHLRRCRRSTSGALRAGVLRAGDGQEHVRHRRIRRHEHRDGGGKRSRRDLNARLAARRAQAGVRARGLDLHRRRSGAVAARRTGAYRVGERYPSPRVQRAGQWRCVLRAGARRAWRPVLGCIRSRRDPRDHARRHQGAYRARDA